MFLLLGPTNYQTPTEIIRIGSIVISVIPNNEWRTLFLKTGNADPDQLMKSRAKPKPMSQSLRNFY